MHIAIEDSVLNSSRSLCTPERSLLLAVLQRALFDFVGNQCEVQESAKEWLFAAEDGGELFSFGWICTHLGLDPDLVRERVGHMCPRSDISAQRWWCQQRLAA